MDYLQRFQPSADMRTTDVRQQVGLVMAEARELAMTGPSVITVSAMSRGGEFRESSELEYGATVPTSWSGTATATMTAR